MAGGYGLCPNPRQLPFRFAAPDAAAEGGERRITLDHERVLMKRRLGRIAMQIQLPLSSYRGVAARLLPGPTEADDRIALVLIHRDRAFDVPLAEAAHGTDIVADWQLWGETLCLPLLVEGVDGSIVTVESALASAPPLPRRRRTPDRRPQFLKRRHAAYLPLVPFVHRDETALSPRD